jgi:hypothetical protein
MILHPPPLAVRGVTTVAILGIAIGAARFLRRCTTLRDILTSATTFPTSVAAQVTNARAG